MFRVSAVRRRFTPTLHRASMFHVSNSRTGASPYGALLLSRSFQSFSKRDEDDLVRVIKAKPRHVLKHVRQQMWRSRKKELQFRNTVTQLMIVLQDHLRKQLLDPVAASSIMEGVLAECVKFGQHDMAHLLFRAFLRFRRFGCQISVDALRHLFESYRETDSTELMRQLAQEMSDDASLRGFCVAAYLFAGDASAAEAILQGIPVESMQTTDLVGLIEGYGKMRNIEKLLILLQQIQDVVVAAGSQTSGAAQPPTPPLTADVQEVFSSLFRLSQTLDHEELFLATMQSALDLKLTLSPVIFATILRYKMRHVTSAEEIAGIEKELETLGYQPDITCNSVVIAAYARLHHFGDKGSEEVMLAKVDTLLASIESRLRQSDAEIDISSAHLRAVIRGYGAAGRPELVKSAWKRLQHNKSISGETRVYNELLKWFSIMGSVKDVLEVKEDMETNTVQADSQTYTWILRALGKFYPRHTEQLLSEIRERHVRPDIQLYTTLIGTLGDLQLFDKVEEIIAEVAQREAAATLQLTPLYYAVLMRVFKKDLNRVEALYTAAKEKNLADHPHVQTILLHVYSSHPEGKEKLAALMQSMPEWTTETYNVMLNMYGKAGDKEKVVQIFEDMRAKGVPMNGVTFGTLVTIFSRLKDNAKLQEVVSLLKQTDGAVNAEFYSILASSLNRLGDSGGVNEAWNDLLSSKLFPGTEVYNQFLMLYGKQHNSQKMQSVLDSMMRYVPPNPVTATTVLDMLGKTGRISEMETLFEDMKKSEDTQPTAVTFHQVLNAFAKTGDVTKMEKIRDEMIARGFPESNVTFNILADGYGRAKRFEQLNEVLQRRKAAGIPMDELGYCVVISAFGKARIAAEILRLVEELKASEGAANLITPKVVWTLIDAFCRCHDQKNMDLWIDELRNFSPNGVFSAMDRMPLIPYYCRVGQFDKVEEIVKQIETEHGAEAVSYTALNTMARGYAKAGMFEKVVALLHQMRDRNLVPDSSTTLALSSAFLKAGLHEQAQQIVEWRRQYAKAAASDTAGDSSTPSSP
jgi:pentatricopeptide repeat protein